MTFTGCPNCGRPIPDTAYFCPDCQADLATSLRATADRWDDVRDAVGRLTRVEPSNGHSTTRRPAYVGPTCEGMACDHRSCELIWKTRTRGRNEVATSNEERGLIDMGAAENAWVVANTVHEWTRMVAQQRGKPRSPEPALRPVDGGGKRHNDLPRCIYSDLPVEMCACGHEHHDLDTAA